LKDLWSKQQTTIEVINSNAQQTQRLFSEKEHELNEKTQLVEKLKKELRALHEKKRGGSHRNQHGNTFLKDNNIKRDKTDQANTNINIKQNTNTILPQRTASEVNTMENEINYYKTLLE